MSPEPRFSSRTRWDLRRNPLTLAVERRRAAGLPIIDLTVSNPTLCGLAAESPRVRDLLARPDGLAWEPNPRGQIGARRALEDLYRGRGAKVAADRFVLSASTSEAYTWLFRILCDPGDEILAPVPSYPLFDHLARVSDVSLLRYPLVEEEGFRIDRESLEGSITDRTRILLAVSPGNPTGTYLGEDEREMLVGICASRGLALVCDEVFGDFALEKSAAHAGTRETTTDSRGAMGGDLRRALTLAGDERALTFVLDGISKMLALPQLKLGWIACSGPEALVGQALERLDLIADTFLSVGSPVQAALPELLALRPAIQATVRARLAANLGALHRALPQGHPAHVLPVQGGWSAILRVPATRTDEEWAIALVEEEGVLVHPGYLFDFPSEGRLVVSLLPEEPRFTDGISRLARMIARA